MALYESASRCVAIRLNIMEKEVDANGRHDPIRSISSRIMQPLSFNFRKGKFICQKNKLKSNKNSGGQGFYTLTSAVRFDIKATPSRRSRL